MSDQLLQTPSQTAGPFFGYGLAAEQYHYKHTQIASGNLIVDEAVDGEKIMIKGRVFDGEGKPITDALVEIWQADASGKYNSSFKGFGRAGTGANEGAGFLFETIKPGSVNGAAPHINVIVFMRGLLVHAYTRIYFSDEAVNENDEVLNSIDAQRRNTLIAQKTEAAGQTIYHFDIHMQGDNETVFFDV